ncbi:hypothetical protein LINGRAHAP2_LOCUS15587 [Linum grandiflorum]
MASIQITTISSQSSPKPFDSSLKPLDSSLICLGLFDLIINFPRKSLKFNMHLPTSIQSEWICHDSSIDRDSSSIQAQKTFETQKIQEHEKTLYRATAYFEFWSRIWLVSGSLLLHSSRWNLFNSLHSLILLLIIV